MVDIKAIIFDMDGVLVDARDWHYEALNKALMLFGAEISRQDHLTTYDGLPTKDKLKMLSKATGFPTGLHDFINEMKQKYTLQVINEKANPTFEHEYALSRLYAQGYKLAVASNSIYNTIDILMEKCALQPYLEFFLSNEDVKMGKPNPEIYTKAIHKLGLSPQQCVIIEDNVNGIKAATAAGGHVMQVANPSQVTYDAIMAFIKGIKG